MKYEEANNLIKTLSEGKFPDKDTFSEFLMCSDNNIRKRLKSAADESRQKIFGNRIYIRGLLEFTNYCSCGCFYCGLRNQNQQVHRYRLSTGEIINACKEAYFLGFRTFVLQGGEDPDFSDLQLCHIVEKLKTLFPDAAVTLSVGEKPKTIYRDFFNAGATRYLLRHETANDELYKKLHPKQQTLANRKQCIFNLIDIGFQTGTGFMIGLPGQRVYDIVEDLKFIYDCNPHMIGIGPFIPATGTPFYDKNHGSADMTEKLLSILRIMKPKALIPSTTALATLGDSKKSKDSSGHAQGIIAGANVIMPNISPPTARKNYQIYNGKKSAGTESASGLTLLKEEMEQLGFEIIKSRGDHPDFSL